MAQTFFPDKILFPSTTALRLLLAMVFTEETEATFSEFSQGVLHYNTKLHLENKYIHTESTSREYKWRWLVDKWNKYETRGK